ncbi:MAG: hypothetical protein RL653_2506 [Pseudomonadota bacterium]|jgi:3',5'-cyclic AMP phosphodiesterase CpdA
MKLAHFSDVHIGGGTAREDARRFCRLVDHAIDRGAEHLLIGGDLVDRGNVEDARPVRAHLKRRGFLHPERLSVVPGNHDIWPISASALFSPGPTAAVSFRNLFGLVKNRDYPAQKAFTAFLDLFAESYRGARTYYSDLALPCVKQVGPLRLGLLDTTSNLLRSHAQGRFDADEARWLREALGELEGPSVLLMHHWPFAWAPVLPFPGDSLDGAPAVLRTFADVNFEDLRKVRRFISAAEFDAVLCGHMHEGDVSRIGEVPVYCMGRSGGETGTFAYDLFTATPRSIRGWTIEVDEGELA